MTNAVSTSFRSSKPDTATQAPTNAGSNPASGVAAFSAVLGLKLGMGLSAIAVAQAPRDAAQTPPAASAEPAPAHEARSDAADAPDAASETEAPADETETDDASDTKASDTAANDAEATTRREQARAAETTAATEPVKAETPSPTASNVAPQASNPAAAHAAADATAPTANAGDATNAVSPADLAPAVAGVDGAAEAASEPVALTGHGKGARSAGRRSTKTTEATADAAPAAKADEPRDPLGLIRRGPESKAEARAEKAEAAANAGHEPKHTPTAEPVQTAAPLPENAPVRFADANAEAHAAHASTNTAQASSAAGALFAPAPGATTNQSASPAGGKAAVGGIASVGGASGSAGSGGAGSGAGGAGSGSAGGGEAGGNAAFSGLLQNRVLGVSFTSARSASTGGSSEPSAAAEAQIARGLAAALRQKGGVMTIRLNPEHLGSMRIDLTIEQGQVTAMFDAQTDEARQILRDNLDSLRRSIEDAGLSVQKIEVAQTTALPPSGGDARTGQDRSPTSQQNSGNPGDSGGSGGQRPRDERRENPREPQASADTNLAPSQEVGRIWADEGDAAHGLLRLRVDALI